jgi:hypothetical protein
MSKVVRAKTLDCHFARCLSEVVSLFHTFMAAENLDNLPPLGSIVALCLAPMVIGIMIEQLLLGIIFSQAAVYFYYHFSSDTSFCRSIVTCLVVSTVLLGMMDLCVHRLLTHLSLYSTHLFTIIWKHDTIS